MNNKTRWNFAIQFVVITFVIFTGLFGVGLIIFTNELNNSLDEQLDTLLSELSDEIEESDGQLSLDKPRRFTKKQPLGRLARIQLYDASGKIVEQHGVEGVNRLILSGKEIEQGSTKLRTSYMVLTSESDQKLGYLQIQLPTTLRDRAISNYIITMGIITASGLALLSITGFILSKSWVKPLETSYQVLRQFTEDATHELKTPIATIEACVDNMEEELESEEQLLNRLKAIKRSTKRMNRLVEDLMLLIQLGFESKELSATPSPVSVSQIVKEVREEFELRMKEKEINFQTSLADEVVVIGLRDKLQRLLINLIENSLRYTDNGGSITLAVKYKSGNMHLTISDTGIGIPEDCIAHIFDRFYRVDKARSRAQGGIGLGLSIVKEIIEIHNGHIQIASKLNQGTTVTITIPANLASHQKKPRSS